MGLQATVIKDIIYAAANYAEAYDIIREKAGFTQEEISDSSKTVDWEKAAALWDMLADITGNEQIGLVVGSEMSLAVNGMVGFMMQASNTLKEALDVYCAYGYMVCPMITFVQRIEGNQVIVELHQNAMWKTTYPRNARIVIDSLLACTVSHIRTLTGKNIYPLAVEVEYAKAALNEYVKVLQCQVLFNAPLHRMIFNADDLQTPILTHDTSVYETFKTILGQKKAIALQTNTADALKNLLLMQFKGRIPTVEEAAENLGMTVRTLQRKLTEEQTSFRNIANEVKKELAMHLMKNPATSITEVADVLGYGDLPAFRRAFKSWTNAAPKAVKPQLEKQYVGI